MCASFWQEDLTALVSAVKDGTFWSPEIIMEVSAFTNVTSRKFFNYSITITFYTGQIWLILMFEISKK